MKLNRILPLMAGIALFFACKKDEDAPPANVAIAGKWNFITLIRNYKQGNIVVKDTLNYAADSNNWTFDTTAHKIYQVKNALLDTVYYKLLDGNKKLVTSTDERFVFGNDSLTITTLEGNQLKLQGHTETPWPTDLFYSFGR
ncbi:hypothetical protein F0L74_14880 [Chitinophaga agrisoli]|uniref:Lipocalin-like protein n=1 Tax=Chitinophaga agrisoli TaxID=2607653 RepID=A0A5B2VWR0_9BACT|nr:hypothetical protein [Chitinophaga agrisoli]KAA2243761.1 hypothetical protein F0L74_14880 [Chitinophaga agrisoli]